MLGRTGNNLFQYAAGRALALKHGKGLALNGSWFAPADWEAVRKISVLPIEAELVRGWSFGAKVLKRSTDRHYLEFSGKPVYREKSGDTSFDPYVLSLPDGSVLMGYFQSHLYFRHIEEKIRTELSFTNRTFNTGSARLADSISRDKTVAIHVRRTDYIGNPNTEICGESYYANAVEELRKSETGLRFFVFSDDPAWCRAMFPGDGFTITDCTASAHDPLNDLHLMSLASHHIIANSSYSWWGAWLGKKPGQRVLMPDIWFHGIISPIEEKRCEGWELIQTRT